MSAADKAGAIGVFIHSYDNPFNVSQILPTLGPGENARTNDRRSLAQRIYESGNAAEIEAGIAAVRAAIRIARREPGLSPESVRITDVVFRGDSRYVALGVQEGRILSYDDHQRAENGDLWTKLRQELDTLTVLGVRYRFELVRRAFNAEADELCNAALDGRDPRTGIRSTACADPVSIERLRATCEALMIRKRPTLRTLPGSLAPWWHAVLHRILSIYNEDSGDNLQRERCRLTLMLAPQVLTLGCGGTIRGNSDFKKLRIHLALLQNGDYFDSCLHELYQQATLLATTSEEALDAASRRQPAAQAMTAEAQQRRTRTLCSRGLFSKVIDSDDIRLAEPTIENISAIRDMYPAAPLPDRLPIAQLRDPYVPKFSDIARAVRRSKRGKASAFSGWTRELIWPIFGQMQPMTIRTAVEGIFRDYIYVERLSEVERRLLRNGVLIPFEYPQTAERPKRKLRPITVLEYFLKVCFIMLLERVLDRDPVLAHSPHTSFKPGGAQTAVAAIVAALEDDRVVIGLDSSNAFNTVSREAAFKYIKSTQGYQHMFPLLNFLYCEESDVFWYEGDARVASFRVTAGTRQGCVSGPWFFCCATMAAIGMLPGVQMTMVVDDTYLIGKNAAEEVIPAVKAFADIGLKMNVEKCRVFSPRAASVVLPRELRGGVARSDFADPLGAVIQYSTGRRAQQAASAAERWLSKVEKKLERIATLVTTMQNKFLILRAVTMHFVYAAATFHGLFRNDLFVKLDKAVRETFHRIVPGLRNTPDLTVQINTPLVDRGFGLFPYELMHDTILRTARDTAGPYLRRIAPELKAPHVVMPGGAKSLVAQWRAATLPQSIVQFTQQRHHCFLKTWPNNHYTTLSDKHFEFGVRLLAQQLVCPNPRTCVQRDGRQVQLATLTPKEYTVHMLTCPTCAALGHHHRHEHVNNVIHRVLRFNGVVSTLNPKGYPLPNNTRGGADLFVTTEQVDAVDVAIVRPDEFVSLYTTLTTRENTKYRDYRQFERDTSFNCVPFVMSVYGEHGSAAYEAAKRWSMRSSSSTTLSDLLTYTQMELIRGLAAGIDLHHARSEATGVQTPLENPNRVSSEFFGVFPFSTFSNPTSVFGSGVHAVRDDARSGNATRGAQADAVGGDADETEG